MPLQAPPSGVAPLRIGLFHDSADRWSAITTWFRAHGHQAWAAQLADMRDTTSEAVRFVRDHNCEVVVFDVTNSYLSNWDFAEALQLLLGRPTVPFVFTTSNKHALEQRVGHTTALELSPSQANLTGLMALVYKAAGRAEHT